MSAIPISDIQERVEKSIYTTIRNIVVSNGYIPDTHSYTKTLAGQVLYDAAKAVCITNKGYAIEVFGMSAEKYKGEKESARIVLVFDEFLPGSIGAGDIYYEWVEETSKYVMSQRPPMTAKYTFKVYLIAKEHKMIRTMIALLGQVMPDMGYIKTYDTSTPLFVLNKGFSSLAYNHGEHIEKVYLYEIQDIYTSLPRVIDSNISKILSIDLGIKLGKPLSGININPDSSYSNIIIDILPEGTTLGDTVKTSYVDAGKRGECSICGGYLYICVTGGTAINSVWEKMVLITT